MLNLLLGAAVNDGEARPDVSGRAGSAAPSGVGAKAVIVVNRLDGRKMALNVDRIERVERNEATSDTNLYFIGGARLTVTDPAEDLIAEIVEAKARVMARAFTLAGEYGRPETSLVPTPLRVFQPEAD
ncbi:MAG: Flagellar and Swarming motility protein [Acidimicrobiaceae bacterium]|nr:Flagellar and Swarming motility protein [Acidimicrobiaceae bacterium]